MSDIHIRKAGRAGRITLTRPEALNAMSYAMCRQIDAALRDWADNPSVTLVVVDAEGDKAFCAGGDIAEIHATGTAGDFAHGRRFWHDEYVMNARIADYPKPVVSFLQGYTMGGGVGIGCHGSHRVVCETSRIAMPECGIGLLPDVGGTLLLARAPGRLGEYLGLTGTRMGPDDALLAGFADHFVPRAHWPDLIARLEETGDARTLLAATTDPPKGALVDHCAEIDTWFDAPSLVGILRNLEEAGSPLAARSLQILRRNAPLAMAATLEALRRVRENAWGIRDALRQEYRFTWRAMEHGDLLEGIRAAIIDKDRAPKWRHGPEEVNPALVRAILAPLGAAELTFTDEQAGKETA